VAFPPLRATTGAELKRALSGAVADLGGAIAEGEKGMRFATDAAWYEAAGCPAVVFGPGEISLAHQPDEHVSVSDLHATARVLALFCARVLA
jgi:acetylornithine deacetylase